jgi:hypothetical protein
LTIAATPVQSEAKGEIVVAAGQKQADARSATLSSFAAANQQVSPAARCATPASGESGLASVSLRKAATHARIDGSSPRT